MNNLIIIGLGGHTQAIISTLLEAKTLKILSIIDLKYKNTIGAGAVIISNIIVKTKIFFGVPGKVL